MSNSVVILTNQNEMSYTGNKARGDGFFGFSDGLHTISFHANSFTGRLWIEATLIEDPTEEDWFIIELRTDTPYVEYDNETKAFGVSFTGNFVYVRASVDRSYLVDQEYKPSVHGVLDKAVLLI